MSKIALVTFNLALAVALAVFVYRMLPYAAGVACGEVTPIPGCAPLGKVEHYGLTASPLLVAGGIIFVALRLRASQPKLSNALLFLLPVAAIILGVYVLGFVTTQP